MLVRIAHGQVWEPATSTRPNFAFQTLMRTGRPKLRHVQLFKGRLQVLNKPGILFICSGVCLLVPRQIA